MRVKVYLKSGNTIEIECEKATFMNDARTMDVTGYETTKPNSNFHIDVKQIEAWQTIAE